MWLLKCCDRDILDKNISFNLKMNHDFNSKLDVKDEKMKLIKTLKSELR